MSKKKRKGGRWFYHSDSKGKKGEGGLGFPLYHLQHHGFKKKEKAPFSFKGKGKRGREKMRIFLQFKRVRLEKKGKKRNKS